MVAELFPFQKEGVTFLCRRKGSHMPLRTGLHDDPGVGKTSQAIGAIDELGLLRGVIIGPAVIRINWPREFRKFSPFHRRICVVKNYNDLLAWQRGHFDVIILSFELATKYAKYFHEDAEIFDFLIIDEVHYLKNPDAKRTKEILGDDTTGFVGIEVWARWGFVLTGTPLPNDPSDCYTQLRFVKALPVTMTRMQFQREYFTRQDGIHSARFTVRDEKVGLLRDMIANNFLKRTLAETGVQLPPLTTTQYYVEGDNTEILALLRQYPDLDQRIIDAAETGSISSVGQDDHIATMRRLIGEAKAIPYAQTILNELTSIVPTDKIVVMAIHRNALDRIRSYLWEHGQIECITIDGRNTPNQREALERAFDQNPRIRVALVNIKAGGVALTLTASARIDMLETDWVPDANFQAIKRVHRFTQERGVICRIITLAGSFDETVTAIVARKIANKAPLERRDAA